MIWLDVEQGSAEWERARLGIPTASQFNRILTAKTLKASSQRWGYRNQLLAEWLLGYPIEFTSPSGWMDRGTRMEPEARALYEFERDAEVRVPGLVLRDDRQVGGSPDGLVGDDGGLEIKAPAIHTHIGYLLEPESLTDSYYHQVQGYLYLTERQWWDVMSYNPELPPVVVRVGRDPEFQRALGAALDEFVADLTAAKERMQEHKAAREAEKGAVTS